MNIIIGCDHGGYDLKEACKCFLEESGKYQVKDVGVFSSESCDYPGIARQVGQAVANSAYDRGILICGSGLGMSMAANRIKGVRAALCHNIYSAMMSRRHNDANILALGGRVTGINLALEIVTCFLGTAFEGGRHQRRINQIDDFSNQRG